MKIVGIVKQINHCLAEQQVCDQQQWDGDM
jgi:hypothetical protein